MKRFLAPLRLRSLRVQVLLWTIAPLTILLIVFSLTGVGSHQVSMRQLAVDENLRLTTVVADMVAERIDTYTASLAATAQLLKHHAGDPAAMSAHLADTSQVLEGVELALADRNGGPLVDPQKSPSWVADAMAHLAQHEAYSQHSPLLAHDGQTLIWHVPIPDSSIWLLGAAPAAQLGIDKVPFTTDGQHPGSLVLLDAQGAQIFGRGPRIDPALVRPAERISTTAGTGTRLGFQHGQEYVTTYAPVRGTDWQLVLNEPWHGLAAPMIRFEEAMPAILLIAVAVSFLTLLFGLLFVVRPLQALSERTRQIGSGNFAATGSRVGGVAEIEELRLAIDQMALQVQSSQAGLERYLHAVTRAQEEERLRLARDLHDETVQTLIAVDHKAQKVQRDLERDPERVRAEVAELRHMAASATAEVRRFSRALRPVYLEDLGLGPALELLASESGAGYTLVGEPRRLAPDTELALYRIAQESLSNARRHARAEQIEVTLTFHPAQVRLAIFDDGIGFDPPATPTALSASGHFGLMGMNERAQLVGAHLDIQSTAGEGTAVVVVTSDE